MTKIDKLYHAIDWKLLGDEFKNCLLFALIKEGMKEDSPVRFEILLENYIQLYKQFLLSTDIYNELNELEIAIKEIHKLNSTLAFQPSGRFNQKRKEQIQKKVNGLTSKITDFMRRHGDDIPLPLIAKGLSDITKEGHAGLRAFQIIKESFRYLIGLHQSVLSTGSITLKFDQKTRKTSIWKQDFLTSSYKFFVPNELLMDHLSTASRRLIIPTVKSTSEMVGGGIEALDQIMSNLIAVNYTSKSRNDLNPNIQFLLNKYEEKTKKDLGDDIAGYIFSPFWFFIYGLIYQDIAKKNHSKAIEIIGQVAANTTIGSLMSTDEKEQETTQRLMAIVESYLIINTFLSLEKSISIDLDEAPLFLIGQKILGEELIIELANIILEVAYNRKIKVHSNDIQSLLYHVFSSESSRLYTFRSYRINPVNGRIQKTGEKPEALDIFEKRLLDLLEDHSIIREILPRLLKEYPSGRGAKIPLRELQELEINEFIKEEEKKEKKKKEEEEEKKKEDKKQKKLG